MTLPDYKRQRRTVLLIEIALISGGLLIAYRFWDQLCDSTLISCLSHKNLSVGSFLLLSLFRPFLLTPVPVFALMAGHAFGPMAGALLAAFGATLSCLGVYVLAKAVGKKLVNPWLSSNLPQTLKFIRSQGGKVVLICRLIPLFPFDLCTFIFGLLDVPWTWLFLTTFLGSLPEAYIFAKMAAPNATLLDSTLTTLTVIGTFCLLPGLVIEFISRKKGTSLWRRLKAMWLELHDEIKHNNDIVKRHVHDPRKTPVLLLYGFFSSRRVLTVLERFLVRRGYEVISFNLGGLFGVFFTRGIKETAEFIDYKLQRQFERHGFRKIHVVAHSKGGLVALWWLLKLGGDRYCKKLVTMGTPFRGSVLTWLALITPAGFILKDLWQMRPGSSFLKDLHGAKIPDDVLIYNFYSRKDQVARGEHGIFRPTFASLQVIPVPLDHLTHFEFLYRRDVGDALAEVLGSPYIEESFEPDSCTELKRVD